MDYARMMELISIQRHDFLNHFQVISGLLQMNREEQAREYINNAARDITRLSRVVHLKVPEAAAVVLLAHYGAAERGIDVEYDVQADLGGCIVPAEKIGSALDTVMLYAIERLTPPENGDRVMQVGIYAEGGGYLFRVQFTIPVGEKKSYDDEAVLRDIDVILSLYGGFVRQSTMGNKTEIAVLIPATD